MSNAVVVTTVVSTSMSEAALRQHVVEQLQMNDRSLRDKLVDADGDANVVTAVLNVDEFLAYLIRRFPRAVDAAISTAASASTGATAEVATPVADDAAPAAQLETRVVTNEMSEIEFMDHMLDQLRSGKTEPAVRRLSEEEWQAVEDEPVGEYFSRNPFLY